MCANKEPYTARRRSLIWVAKAERDGCVASREPKEPLTDGMLVARRCLTVKALPINIAVITDDTGGYEKLPSIVLRHEG